MSQTGLDKLASTEAKLQDMQELLKHIKPEIEKAAEAAAGMIQEITQDTVSNKTTLKKLYILVITL